MAQPALLVLAGMGIGLRLFHVLHGDQADAAVGVVDDQQLLDAVLVQQALRLLLADAFLDGDQPFLGHQGGDRLLRVLGEAHVAVGQHADQLLGLALDHRNAGDLVAVHQGQGVGQGLVGMDGDRIDHHARFELLDPADLVGLLFDGEVLVDHAHAAGLGQGNGETPLGHRVHGRGQQRDAQLDGAGQPGARVGLVWEDCRLRRLEKDVVESKSLSEFHAYPLGGDWRRIIHIGPAMPSGLRRAGRRPGARPGHG
jgi:hypothetical protein